MVRTLLTTTPARIRTAHAQSHQNMALANRPETRSVSAARATLASPPTASGSGNKGKERETRAPSAEQSQTLHSPPQGNPSGPPGGEPGPPGDDNGNPDGDDRNPGGPGGYPEDPD